MVQTVMNRLNILRLFQSTVTQIVLDPGVPREDTALFPGQRCESGCESFFLRASLKGSEKVPAEFIAWALDPFWISQVAMRKVF